MRGAGVDAPLHPHEEALGVVRKLAVVLVHPGLVAWPLALHGIHAKSLPTPRHNHPPCLFMSSSFFFGGGVGLFGGFLLEV